MRESGKRLLVLNNKLVDDLYVEAMVLADEARAYLELGAAIERALLDPFDRVLFSCESLKVTTRVMQVIAWLLTQRAVVGARSAVRKAAPKISVWGMPHRRTPNAHGSFPTKCVPSSPQAKASTCARSGWRNSTWNGPSSASYTPPVRRGI